MNLSASDFQRLLSSVELLNSDSKPQTLSERTISAARFLVPNEMTVFDGFHGPDGKYGGPLWYSPPGTVSQDLIQVLADRVNEHPCHQSVILRKENRPVRISDFIPLSRYHRTVLYNEFFKHIGGDTQLAMRLPVSPNLTVVLSLLRVKNDFSEHDLEMSELIAPHIISAFCNAEYINRIEVERQQFEVVLHAIGHGAITLDMDLNIQTCNRAAAVLLQDYFSASPGKLSDELMRYVRHYKDTICSGEFYLPPAPLEVRRNGSRVKAWLSFEAEFHTFILLLIEASDPRPADFISLGLTSREAEILFWITRGKSNIETGRLLGISWRTVQKHIEHIYQKLGVETRAAAVSRALEAFT